MSTHTFVKEHYSWYLSLADHPKEFNLSDFAFMDGSPYLLDLVSSGLHEISVCLDTEPFEKAVACKLIEHGSAAEGGGYYRMLNDKGEVLKSRVWVCDVLLHAFGDIPDCFYLKRVPCLS